MRTLAILLILLVPVSADAAGDDLVVDRVTLSTFHRIIDALESLTHPVEYSSKIVCDADFGSIVLTIHNRSVSAKTTTAILGKVREGMRAAHTAHHIEFELYVEVLFSQHPDPLIYPNRLFLIGDNHYERISFSKSSPKSSEYYQRDISPYHQRGACSVCGGGSTLTKYGKLSHVYGCRYTVIGMHRGTLRTTAVSKARKVRSKRAAPKRASIGKYKTIRVKGYYRKDGTYVKPHTRRVPRR